MIPNGRAAPPSSSRRLLRFAGCLSLAFFACRSPQTTLVADDFSDGVLDSMWVVPTDCGGVREEGGELVLDYVSCGRSLTYVMDREKWTLCGDFDVSVDFSLSDFDVGSYVLHASLGILNLRVPARRAVIERLAASPPVNLMPATQNYKCWIDDASSNSGATKWAVTDDMQGRFRIRRAGDEVRLFYWHDGWVLLRTALWTDEEVIIAVYVASTSWRAPDFQARFDNLRIAGTVCRDYKAPGADERLANALRHAWGVTRAYASGHIWSPLEATVTRPHWVQWDASCGLPPDRAGPFQFVTNSPEIEPHLQNGVLRLDTTASGRLTDLAGYRQVAGLRMPRRFVLEARLRVVQDRHAPWQDRAVVIHVMTGERRGVTLEIGADELFVARADEFRGATSRVDTDDSPHTYRIEIEGNTVDIFYDGAPLIQTMTEHHHWFADRPFIQFGDINSYAMGVSEWYFVRHNACRFKETEVSVAK